MKTDTALLSSFGALNLQVNYLHVLEGRLEATRAKKGEDHPDVAKWQEQIEKLRAGELAFPPASVEVINLLRRIQAALDKRDAEKRG